MAWALVTGGAKRLGAEICRTLAKNGYDVLIHYRRSAHEAQDIQQRCLRYGVRAETLQGDFSTTESMQTFIKELKAQYPKIAIVINNVGNFFAGSALQTPLEEGMALFQLNLHTPLALIQALIPSLKTEQGSVINIGMAGINSIKADEKYTLYRMAKMSLLMLTKSLAKELASSHVRVNMVSPGELTISSSLSQTRSLLPMQRAATVEEVAKVVAFLLSPDSAYITGQNIEVAGGLALS
ncbi:MAG: SDR family oxidoreductase [Waddliaceae bacterium]